MKVYKCDSCGVEIKEPHKVGMKEFCYEVSNCDWRQIFMPVKRKKKIHLCGACYRGLYILAKREDLMLVKTKDIVVRNNKKYEVVIADDNIFVICPIVHDEKEQSDVVKYDKAEIYANQDCINTLKELGFEKWKS